MSMFCTSRGTFLPAGLATLSFAFVALTFLSAPFSIRIRRLSGFGVSPFWVCIDRVIRAGRWLIMNCSQRPVGFSIPEMNRSVSA